MFETRRARRIGILLAAPVLFAWCGGCDEGGAPVIPRAAAEGAPAGDAPDTPTPAPAPRPRHGRPLRSSDRSLADIVRTAQKGARTPIFLPPEPAEMRAFAAAFERLLEAALAASQLPERAQHAGPQRLPLSFRDAPRIHRTLAELGFEITVLERGGLLVIAELDGVRRGGGLFALRTRLVRERRTVVLQAPHSLFDQGTGVIARAWFEQRVGSVLMINTAHRRRGAPRGVSADLAHIPASYFQAATRAVARALPHATVLQVHGFSSRTHPELGGAQVVLSQGSAAGVRDPGFEQLAGRWRRLLGAQAVRVYGRDAHTLGGTTNVQGRAINALSEARFYHLELGEQLREKLQSASALRRSLGEAIRALATPLPTDGTGQAR